MKSTRLWILVIDGAHARFLRYYDKKRGAITIEHQSFTAQSVPTRNIGSDKPGRTFGSRGKLRHAIEPRIDLHEEEEKHFLTDVVKKLEKAFDENAFEDLFVIAQPKSLGFIRDLLSDRLRKQVCGECVGDYTRHNDKEISRLVTEALTGTGRLIA